MFRDRLHLHGVDVLQANDQYLEYYRIDKNCPILSTVVSRRSKTAKIQQNFWRRNRPSNLGDYALKKGIN